MSTLSIPRLTYFSSRGLSEVIRLLLAEAKVEFEDYGFGVSTPEGFPKPLLELKASGQLAFGAVPLWEEPDGFKLVQSRAIARHISRMYGLYGSSNRESALIDQVLEGVDDLRLKLMPLRTCPEAQRADERNKFVSEVLPQWLGFFERLLARNNEGKGFFVGSRVSYADFAVWLMLEMLRDNELNAKGVETPLLDGFFERVAALESVKSHLSSGKRYPVQLLPK
eukprot:TRINITY_DN6618_c0_g1_i1.p1 TRINITY_DN6618_c0_g1~~TRINITY_DN6618_c0_g1_i1.p1  ORF type:complete len:224 (-),score=41.71 TRINITY_DN6618_c0_g1_i1:168-839(-)